jgi:hypothetical protein
MMTCHHQPLVFEFKKFATGLKCILFFLQHLYNRHISDNFNSLSRIFFENRRRRLAGGLNSAALRSGFELYFQRFDSPGWNYYLESNFWQKPMRRGLNAVVGRIKKPK